MVTKKHFNGLNVINIVQWRECTFSVVFVYLLLLTFTKPVYALSGQPKVEIEVEGIVIEELVDPVDVYAIDKGYIGWGGKVYLRHVDNITEQTLQFHTYGDEIHKKPLYLVLEYFDPLGIIDIDNAVAYSPHGDPIIKLSNILEPDVPLEVQLRFKWGDGFKRNKWTSQWRKWIGALISFSPKIYKPKPGQIVPPKINVVVTPQANINGWHNTDVTIDYVCTQGTAKVVNCPSSQIISAEGKDQKFVAKVIDDYDLSAEAVTVLNIDKTPPVIQSSQSPKANIAGWNNSDVTLSYSCEDALSGVVNCPVNNVLSNEGDNQEINVSITDLAGNKSVVNDNVRIDKTAPIVQLSQSPLANPAGWNNTDVTIEYNCQDDLSGVSGCPQKKIISNEGANQNFDITVADVAGNIASLNHLINIDKTPPVAKSSQFPASNKAGWNNTNVTLNYTCSDSLSGISVCPSERSIDNEGQGQSIDALVTDIAGNTITINNVINIDKTGPKIQSSRSPVANKAGWNNTNVTLSYICEDGISGVINCPNDQVISEEGAEQSIEASISDIAGNTISINDILNIDKVAPTISLKQIPEANEAGWNNTDITLNYTCEDSLSGVGECQPEKVINTEGKDQDIEVTVKDVAGNTTSILTTVNIDKTPPEIQSAIEPSPNTSGWNNSDVTLNYTCEDTLSGVKECAPVNVITQEGENQKIDVSVIDIAGNETVISNSLNIDKTPPNIQSSQLPVANDSGWNNTDVTLNYVCEDLLSGIETCPEENLVSNESADQLFELTISDLAGNTASISNTLSIDKTPPDIQSLKKPLANKAGWNNTDVTLSYTCQDTLSGVQQCPEEKLISTEGLEQVYESIAIDIAGNKASINDTLNVDKTAPTIVSSQSPDANATGWNKNNVALTYDCQDTLSGIASCSPDKTVMTEGGEQNFEGTVVDVAGNTAAIVNILNIDKTPPVIKSTQSPAANSAGWNNSDVTISYICEDAISGIAACPGAEIVSSEGRGQSYNVTVADIAGNAIASTHAVSLDKTQPVITVSDVIVETNDSSITVSGRVVDPGDQLSGLDHVSITATGVTLALNYNESGWFTQEIPLQYGQNTLNFEASDNAGNNIAKLEQVKRISIPEVTITSPAKIDTITTQDTIDIAGYVDTLQSSNNLIFSVNDFQANVQPGNTSGTYAFSYKNLPLEIGDNSVVVSMFSPEGSDVVQLNVRRTVDTAVLLPPAIIILTPKNNSIVSDSAISLAGTIEHDFGKVSAALNGQPLELKKMGVNTYKFDSLVSFNGNEEIKNITVTATDALGQQSSKSITVRYDSQKPEIVLDSSLNFSDHPEVNTLESAQPTISGVVKDNNLSNIWINEQPLSVTPIGNQQYRFETNISLPVGEVENLKITARDESGNKVSKNWLVRRLSAVDVEWLSPSDSVELDIPLGKSHLDLPVGIKVNPSEEASTVRLKWADKEKLINSNNGLYIDTLNIAEGSGEYALTAEVLDSNNNVLISDQRSFIINNVADIPVNIEHISPARDAKNIEPTQIINVSFNRPIEPEKLSVFVNETLHGLTYVNRDPVGADFLQSKGHQLEEVHRDQVHVPGSVLVDNNGYSLSFSPQRYYGYDAQLFVTVNYDGQELLRTQYTVRPLPTLIRGVVHDVLGQPLPNIEVSFPDIPRTAVTNQYGAFAFGFAEPYSQHIKGGRYKLAFNDSLKSSGIGSLRTEVTIENGRVNNLGSYRVALLSEDVRNNFISSNKENVLLNGDLKLDLNRAKLLFPTTKNNQGTVLAQFEPAGAVFAGKRPGFQPLYYYSLYPQGVSVEGKVTLDMKVEPYNGSFDYMGTANYVLIHAYDSVANIIDIIGVGEYKNGRVNSVQPLAIKSLNHFGFSPIDPLVEPYLRDYVDGKISFNEMLSNLPR